MDGKITSIQNIVTRVNQMYIYQPIPVKRRIKLLFHVHNEVLHL